MSSVGSHSYYSMGRILLLCHLQPHPHTQHTSAPTNTQTNPASPHAATNYTKQDNVHGTRDALCAHHTTLRTHTPLNTSNGKYRRCVVVFPASSAHVSVHFIVPIARCSRRDKHNAMIILSRCGGFYIVCATARRTNEIEIECALVAGVIGAVCAGQHRVGFFMHVAHIHML